MKRPYQSSSSSSSIDDVSTEDEADLPDPEEVLADDDQMTEEFSEVFADASITCSEVLADAADVSTIDDNPTTEHQASSSDQVADEEVEKEEEKSSKVLWSLLGGFGALGAVAAISTVFGIMTSGPPVDEDDIVAAVAIAKGGEAGGTAAAAGGAATQGATSAQTAVLQQMAVSAANNAASSVASGSQALSNAAAGAAGNAGAASSSGNTATTAAASATAVAATAAAVAAGVVVSQQSSGGVPPICPNTTNASLYLGSLSLDFLGNKSFLTLSEATNLTTKFLEEYNIVFGCESDYSRLSLNCSIPCFDVLSDDNSTSELQCCGLLDVPFFGDIMRCDMQCTVHCDGCFPNEPMFWVNETDESLLSDVLAPQVSTAVSTSDSNKRHLDENLASSPDEEDGCSPACQVGNAVGAWFCEEISPDDPDCSILIITSYDVVTGEPTNALEFVDRPTAAPSSAPSVVPSISPTPLPSAAPTPLPPPLEYFLIRVLPEYQVLRQFFSGDVISLARDGVYLSIEVIPRKRDNVGSIVFTLVSRDGEEFPPRNDPPFTLGGTRVGADGNIEYRPVFQLAWTGQKELFVTTYSEDWGRGNELLTEVLSFEVVE